MLVLKFKDVENKLNLFNSSNNYDLKLVLAINTKTYRLRKKMLHQSKFFLRYITSDKTSDQNMVYITKKLEASLFEKVLQCFYGGELSIPDGTTLYYAYEILQYFSIAELIQQVHDFLLRDTSIVLVGVQISELFEVQELSQYYSKYFQYNGFGSVFNEKVDVCAARKLIQQTKNRTAPLNYLLLEEAIFKKLVYLHNNLSKDNFDDTKYITQIQLAHKIKEYFQVRYMAFNIKLNELLQDLIDRSQLTQSQYKKLLNDLYEEVYQQESMSLLDPTNSAILTASEQNNDSSIDESELLLCNEIHTNHIEQHQIQLDSFTSKVEQELNKPLFSNNEVDVSFLVGQSKLFFVFTTQYSRFGFYSSVVVQQSGQFMQDSELYLFNLSTMRKVESKLRIHRIRFGRGVNVDGRLVIEGNKGWSRFDDENEDGNGNVVVSGQRVFQIVGFEAIVLISLCVLVMSAHNQLRHNKQNNHKETALAQTKDVEYVDDDAVYVDESAEQEKATEEQPVQYQGDDDVTVSQEAVVQAEAAATGSDSEEQQYTQEEMEAMDQAEQLKYDEDQKQMLKIQQISDEDQYTAVVDDQLLPTDDQEEMPIDVVEHQLNPTEIADNLDESQGMDTPFAPADGTQLLLDNDEDNAYEVKPVEYMEGETPYAEFVAHPPPEDHALIGNVNDPGLIDGQPEVQLPIAQS